MLIDNVVDSIESPQTTGAAIPAAILNATAIVAYQFGNSWPTYGPYCDARPDLAKKGWIISTTLTCDGPARMYDIEDGGGHISNIGRFMQQADRTWGKPILYTFASGVAAMIEAADDQGYDRDDYYIYSAHPDSSNGKHICGPNVCGYPTADATQYTFRTPGNCDTGIFQSYVLPGSAPPPPPPKVLETDMIAFYVNMHRHDEYVLALESGQVVHRYKNDEGKWSDAWEDLGHPTTSEIPIVGITASVNGAGHDEVGVKLKNGQVKHLWKVEDPQSHLMVWNRHDDGGFAWDRLR